MTKGSIPTVKFADPETMSKMFADTPLADDDLAAAPPKEITEDGSFPIMTPDTTPDTDNIEGAVNDTARDTVNDTARDVEGSLDAPHKAEALNNAIKSVNPASNSPDGLGVDSPDPTFSNTYANLSKAQRRIVDEMAAKLDIMELFKYRRFFLDFTIIPSKLRVRFASITDQESRDLWADLRQYNDGSNKVSNLELELILNLKKCQRYVKSINNTDMSPEVFPTFDSVFISMLANYISLFELAKMKVLYSNFLTVKGI